LASRRAADVALDLDRAAKLDEIAVSGASDDAPVMGGDGGVHPIAASARNRDNVRSSSAPE
jgi:hypothetical protein